MVVEDGVRPMGFCSAEGEEASVLPGEDGVEGDVEDNAVSMSHRPNARILHLHSGTDPPRPFSHLHLHLHPHMRMWDSLEFSHWCRQCENVQVPTYPPGPAGRIGVPIVLMSPLSAADRSLDSASENAGP
jgi:hypothetical protein